MLWILPLALVALVSQLRLPALIAPASVCISGVVVFPPDVRPGHSECPVTVIVGLSTTPNESRVAAREVIKPIAVVFVD